MEKVLFITQCVPVSVSPHAGGQMSHYYVKKMNDNSNIDLRLICYGDMQEEKLVPYLQEEGFNAFWCSSSKEKFLLKIVNKFSKTTYGFIPLSVAKKIKYFLHVLKNSGFIPQTCIFEWEESAFILPIIKRVFPDIKTSVIEIDVKWQSLYRFYKQSSNYLKKIYYYYLYRRLLKADKKYFVLLDEIVVISQKDKQLVECLNIVNNKIRIIPPYFHDYSNIPIDCPKEQNVLFYGYLKREENLEAIRWFIKEVMPICQGIKFIIIGGGVTEEINALQNDKIIITGYLEVDEIERYFSNALCMVVPLFHGAGTKIKVLEAMSAGLPVLTNKIGIEGINAIDGKTYFHCETPDDYYQAINKLQNNGEIRIQIGVNSRKMVEEDFNYHKANYLNRIEA